MFIYIVTHWSRATHLCVSNLTINGFRSWLVGWPAPSHYLNRCWNIINWPLAINFSESLSEIQIFSFKKMHLEMASAKWRPFCLGLNVLNIVPALVIMINKLILPNWSSYTESSSLLPLVAFLLAPFRLVILHVFNNVKSILLLFDFCIIDSNIVCIRNPFCHAF